MATTLGKFLTRQYWLVALFMCAVTSAQAQVLLPDDMPPEVRQSLQKSTAELNAILDERGVTEQRTKELEIEVEAIRKDRAAITAALIQSAKTEKKLAADIFQLQEDLLALETQKADIQIGLWERRGALAEVLAALQRMGLNPPPAILVTPEDALGSVRSSILLSAVVPHMRAETEILIADIQELDQITGSITSEQEKLKSTRQDQAAEQKRLSLLVEEKRKIEGQTAAELVAQQKRMTELLAQAESMESFISSLEDEAERVKREAEEKLRAEEQARIEEEQRKKAEAEAARLAAEKAREDAERAKREADEAQQLAAEQKLREAETARLNAELEQREAQMRINAARERAAELAAKPSSIAPAAAFSTRSGQLAKPVSGRTITAFGDDDGLGQRAQGDTLETSPNAIVTAPADGKVLYAGPFRAYGNLLIIDAGEEYHLVLAGMDRIDVAQGQFVLEGEPVGAMGRIRLASVTAAATKNDNPTLYIEFRKNSKPIDPSPWWEKISAGRT